MKITYSTRPTVTAETHTLYLAGPMTGFPLWNFPAFDQARNFLRREGFAVVCPAEMDRELGFDEHDERREAWTPELAREASRRDLRAITHVDAVAVLSGFTQSTGARVELTAARWIGLPIVAAFDPSHDLTDAVDVWLREERLESDLREFEEQTVRVPSGRVIVRETATQDPIETDGWYFSDPMHDDDPVGGYATGGVVSRGERTFVIGEALRLVGLTPDEELGEVRVVDPSTGGAKGSKLARFDLLPTGSLWQIAEHFGRGAEKYEARNWERGYAWSLSYAALCRHLFAWWGGEDVDEETGSSHLAAVGFHVLALLHFLEHHPDGDDRP